MNEVKTDRNGYTEEQITRIMKLLKENGYAAAYGEYIGFDVTELNLKRRKMAELSESLGTWSVSTVSSHWNLEEAKQFQLDLEEATDLLESINEILGK